MSNLGYAGRVEIKEVNLVKPTDQMKHDIKLFVTEVNIDTSIVDASMTVEFLILDAQNLFRKTAMEIGDIIEFVFSQYDEQRTLRMRVFKLDDIKDFTKERSYSIYCHSELFYVSQFVHLSRAYKGTFSEIAYSIFKDATWEDHSIWEQTSKNRSFICPQWSPLEAITWLAKNSESSTTKTRMRFFQNSIGNYNFTSIEKLVEIGQDPVHEYKQNVSTRLKDGATNTENELKKIEVLTYGTAFDFVKTSSSGAFSGERNQVDLTKKTLDTKTYNYWRDTDTSKLMNKQLLNAPLYTGHSRPKACYVSSKTVDNIEENFLNGVSALRSTFINNKQSVTIVVKGNNIVDVGNIVELSIPSPEPQSAEGNKTIDPYWSGRYMVAAKRDMFQKEMHTMSLVLVKDSF